MNPLEVGSFTGDEGEGTTLRAIAASPRVVEKVNGMANLSAMNNENRGLTTGNLPRKTSDEICLDRCSRATSDCTLPVCLIRKKGSKISNQAYDTEYEAVLGTKSQVRSTRVAWDRGNARDFRE